MGKTVVLEKQEAAGKEGDKDETGDFIQEALGLSLQELSRAAEDRAGWTPLLHRVARTQS